MIGAAALLAAALAADPRAQLGTLEARRRAEEQAAALLREQERSVLGTLDEAEAALAEAVEAYRGAEADRALAEAALARARAEEARAAGDLDARLGALAPRLRARARMGRAGELGLLLASHDLAELVKRRFLFDRILGRDLALVSGAKAALAAREAARAAQEREAARVAALARDAAEKREVAEARREERETLLAALRTARTFHERAAREADVQARQLAEFVKNLPPPRAGAGAALRGFATLRGRLPAPAPGPISVAFGRVVNPRFNTVTVQNGIDIAAPAGTPVRAIAPGRVVHAGWFKGYGNLVIVDHGEGYHTLVAHLASMRTAMGEDVEAGAVLGAVGDSGSLKGPYLYFEVRERGRPVDPRPWLAPAR